MPGALAVRHRARHDLLHLLDAREHRRELHERHARGARDQARDGGLAGAGRAPQHDARQVPAVAHERDRAARVAAGAAGPPARRTCAGRSGRRAAPSGPGSSGSAPKRAAAPRLGVAPNRSPLTAGFASSGAAPNSDGPGSGVGTRVIAGGVGSAWARRRRRGAHAVEQQPRRLLHALGPAQREAAPLRAAGRVRPARAARCWCALSSAGSRKISAGAALATISPPRCSTYTMSASARDERARRAWRPPARRPARG